MCSICSNFEPVLPEAPQLLLREQGVYFNSHTEQVYSSKGSYGLLTHHTFLVLNEQEKS